jgi:hypothetical protein
MTLPDLHIVLLSECSLLQFCLIPFSCSPRHIAPHFAENESARANEEKEVDLCRRFMLNHWKMQMSMADEHLLDREHGFTPSASLASPGPCTGRHWSILGEDVRLRKIEYRSVRFLRLTQSVLRGGRGATRPLLHILLPHLAPCHPQSHSSGDPTHGDRHDTYHSNNLHRTPSAYAPGTYGALRRVCAE